MKCLIAAGLIAITAIFVAVVALDRPAQAGWDIVWIDQPGVVVRDWSPVTVTIMVRNSMTGTINFSGSLKTPRKMDTPVIISSGTNRLNATCDGGGCIENWYGSIPPMSDVSYVTTFRGIEAQGDHIYSSARIIHSGFEEYYLEHSFLMVDPTPVPNTTPGITPVSTRPPSTATATPTSTLTVGITPVVTQVATAVATPDYTQVRIQQGWSLIALPSGYLRYTAASLLDEVDMRCLGVYQVSRWENGAWESYIKDLPTTGFPIEPGRGYFVRSRLAGTWRPFEPPSPYGNGCG